MEENEVRKVLMTMSLHTEEFADILHDLLKVQNHQKLKASDVASTIFMKNVLHAAEIEEVQ